MRIALGVEYDGAAFRGFQFQTNAPSVQAALEAGLGRIADEPVRLAAAGRTDAGVHATGQVVGFDTAAERPLEAWVRGVNAVTPAGVKVRWARRVDPAFHARYSAVARRYQYVFHDDRVPSPLLAGRVTPARPLDADAMHRAAQWLLGEHDFSSFRAAGCQSLSAHRCVHRLTVSRAASFVVVDITANAFLLHTVRNVAGALADVGTGARAESWLRDALLARDRGVVGATAAPDGLYLVDVHYPDQDFPPGRPAGPLQALGGLDRF